MPWHQLHATFPSLKPQPIVTHSHMFSHASCQFGVTTLSVQSAIFVIGQNDYMSWYFSLQVLGCSILVTARMIYFCAFACSLLNILKNNMELGVGCRQLHSGNNGLTVIHRSIACSLNPTSCRLGKETNSSWSGLVSWLVILQGIPCLGQVLTLFSREASPIIYPVQDNKAKNQYTLSSSMSLYSPNKGVPPSQVKNTCLMFPYF